MKCVAATLFALAAGGPELAHGAPAGRRVRILLARGASLGAREGSGTRFDLARSEARRAIDALAAEDRVDLHLAPVADDEPRSELTREDAKAAVDRVRLVDAPSALEARAALLAAAASELARDPSALPVFVISDEPPGSLAFAPELAAAARFAVVGAPQGNHGFLALASRRDERGKETLLAAVANRDDRPATLTLTLRLAASPDDPGGATITRMLALGPGETRSELVDVDSRTGAVFASLSGGDALAVDDRAIALRVADAPVRIAIVGDLGTPLETALRSVPGTTVETFPEDRAPATGHDLTVLTWRNVSQRQPGGSVVFVAPRDTPDAEIAPPLSASLTRIETWFPGTDLVPGLEGVKAVKEELPEDFGSFEPLVADAHGRTLLAARAPTHGSFFVYVGLALPRTPRDPWASTPSFPRFWANVVERVRERPGEPADLRCEPTGDPLALPRPADAEPGDALTVTAPSGHVRLVQDRFVPLEAGIHRVRAEHGKASVAFAAALLDPGTEDLRRAHPAPFGALDMVLLARRSSARASASLAWVLALLGLVFAGAAWALENQAARSPRER